MNCCRQLITGYKSIWLYGCGLIVSQETYFGLKRDSSWLFWSSGDREIYIFLGVGCCCCCTMDMRLISESKFSTRYRWELHSCLVSCLAALESRKRGRWHPAPRPARGADLLWRKEWGYPCVHLAKLRSSQTHRLVAVQVLDSRTNQAWKQHVGVCTRSNTKIKC